LELQNFNIGHADSVDSQNDDMDKSLHRKIALEIEEFKKKS
jgi:hypothetical protein